MAQFHSLIAFAFVAGLLTITPGLDTALVLRTAAVEGTRSAMMAALGIALGCLGWAVATSVGLGALVAASQFAYDVLRIVGGGFVIWLGGRMLWSAITRNSAGLQITLSPSSNGARSWLVRGFLTNILNPKVGVFYVSLLPLFIPPHANVMAFSMLLGLLHAAEGLAWFWLLTSAIKPLASWIARGNVARWFDGVAGAVLILFGGALLLERH
ncbi:MAG: LysE family translocator [Terriglobia bacterium]|nr:LysE family translocator [Terriglobia bacterium]